MISSNPPRALLFDVFGTVVDRRTSIACEVTAALAARLDSLAFADRCRSLDLWFLDRAGM
ncbi:hypothetical protein BJI47_19465 [Rhodococcus sp. 1168]|nr:hypothetical protein BJI47_19465 [Rhodococcus sp. 1168]